MESIELREKLDILEKTVKEEDNRIPRNGV